MGNVKRICIVASDMRGDYNDDYIVGCELQAESLGYKTEVFTMLQLSELSTYNEESIYHIIDFNRYDGIIYIERSFSRHKDIRTSISKLLKENCTIPMITIGEDGSVAAFAQDHSKKIELLADHLIEVHGAKTLYFLGGVVQTNSTRIQGFRHALEKHNIPYTEDNILYGGYWIDCAEKLAKKIAFHDIDKPDAIMCYNDTIAFALIRSLYHYGLRVPGDILVTGCNGANEAFNQVVSITTVSMNGRLMGSRAVADLYALMTGEEAPYIREPAPKIITGYSCGCDVLRTQDVRFMLESHEKREREQMEFRNSRLEERTYHVKSINELTEVIKNTKYLLPDCRCFSVNTLDPENPMEAECIYLTQSIEGKNTTPFPSYMIYPEGYEPTEINHTHIMPLMSKRELVGFIAIGFDEAIVPCHQIKLYTQILSNALDILSLRQTFLTSAPSTQIPPISKLAAANVSRNSDNHDDLDYDDENDNSARNSSAVQSPNILMVVKNDITSKVKTENILYFEAYGKDVNAVLKSGEYGIKMKLFELESLLKQKHFLRISKSVVVNMDKVTSFKSDTPYTLEAYLISGHTVHVSRKYVPDFKNFLNKL